MLSKHKLPIWRVTVSWKALNTGLGVFDWSGCLFRLLLARKHWFASNLTPVSLNCFPVNVVKLLDLFLFFTGWGISPVLTIRAVPDRVVLIQACISNGSTSSCVVIHSPLSSLVLMVSHPSLPSSRAIFLSQGLKVLP